MGKKKARDTSTWTKPRQFRLSDETLAELDWLIERFALRSRADAIRLATHRLVITEGKATGDKPPPRKVEES